jgi:hypothetical protein
MLFTHSGTILTHHGLGVNATGTDLSIASLPDADYMYVMANAYKSVHTFKISGPGKFELTQRSFFADVEVEGLVETTGYSVSVSEKFGEK